MRTKHHLKLKSTHFSLNSTSFLTDPKINLSLVLDESSGNTTPVFFLSLFLLILAFFILLVSITTFEDVKSQAVMDSLTSTFATVLTISSDPTQFLAKDENVFAGQQFQDQISDIFLTAIPVAKVELVQPDNKLHATFPIDSMFAADS